MDRETIIALTQCVRLYRFIRRFEDETGNLIMPIKWNITSKATEARGHMEAISRAYDKLNENARGHRADVEGIAGQVHDMQSDLESAANVMGNGGERSGEEKNPTGVKSTDGQKNASTVTLEAGEVGEQSTNTFHPGQ